MGGSFTTEVSSGPTWQRLHSCVSWQLWPGSRARGHKALGAAWHGQRPSPRPPPFSHVPVGPSGDHGHEHSFLTFAGLSSVHVCFFAPGVSVRSCSHLFPCQSPAKSNAAGCPARARLANWLSSGLWGSRMPSGSCFRLQTRSAVAGLVGREVSRCTGCSHRVLSEGGLTSPAMATRMKAPKP